MTCMTCIEVCGHSVISNVLNVIKYLEEKLNIR